jgi:CMP-N-acetylneuraminic acid synthetase
MKILGIIPARKGSKRIPNKNLKLFGGKPLFSYIAEAALASKMLDDIVISTDHSGIIDYTQLHFPRITTLERPPDLSGDASPAIDYVTHALHHMKNAFGKEYDVVVILQPSSPLTLGEDIDRTISLLITSEADTAVSVVRLNHMIHPVKMKIMDQDRLLPFIEEEKGRMTSYELPQVYVRNCAVYVTRLHVIQQGNIIGKDCRGFVMPAERSVDINEMIDFLFAEFLLASQSE